MRSNAAVAHRLILHLEHNIVFSRSGNKLLLFGELKLLNTKKNLKSRNFKKTRHTEEA
jgi:hypothetical protein